MSTRSYYGELIRKYRVSRGMTQEALAKDICSASELSKIETGSRVPSADVFMALMKALGVYGYSFFSMLPDEKLKMMNLKKSIRAAADRGKADELVELMHTFRGLMDTSKVEDVVFAGMAELIYYRMNGLRDKSFGRKSLEYLQNVHPGLIEDIGVYENSLTRQERVLVNSIGLGFVDEGEYENAYRFFHFMYKGVHDDSDEMPEIIKSRAVALNNMSLCMSKLKHYDAAQRMCRRAIEFAYGCDVRLWVGALETSAENYQRMGVYDKANDILGIIGIQERLSKKTRIEMQEVSLYNHSDGMLML